MSDKKYTNYFKNHYKLKINEGDLYSYEKWFTSQWKYINKKIKFKKQDKILEVGSGIGGVFNFIQKGKYDTYVGLEMDKNAMKFANAHFKVDKFKNISLEKYKTSSKFDFVLAFEVLEHLDNPNESIKKIYRILDQKGVFVGTSPYPFQKNVLADETHRYVLHPESWKKLFIESGFRKVETYPMSFFPSIWRVSKHLNWLIPIYLPFPYVISTTLIVAYK